MTHKREDVRAWEINISNSILIPFNKWKDIHQMCAFNKKLLDEGKGSLGDHGQVSIVFQPIAAHTLSS